MSKSARQTPAPAGLVTNRSPMNAQRRRWLAAAAAVASGLWQAGAQAQNAPANKVLLSIGGNVHKRPGAEAVDFDLAAIEQLPQHQFFTKTPWFAQPRKYTGVLVRDLLAAVGGSGSTLKAMALNDYRVEIPAEDWTRNDVMVAYLLDDKPMAVRERGPLLIIYPFDDRRELRTAIHYSRAVWQLRSLEIR